MTIQQVLDRAFFLPGQVILLPGLDGAVTHSLGIVARHHQLHGGKERLDELGLLVIKVLTNALIDCRSGTFQLQHG
ncbi:hypothetical protein D3C72_2392150 [compost metagenome]